MHKAHNIWWLESVSAVILQIAPFNFLIESSPHPKHLQHLIPVVIDHLHGDLASVGRNKAP